MGAVRKKKKKKKSLKQTPKTWHAFFFHNEWRFCGSRFCLFSIPTPPSAQTSYQSERLFLSTWRMCHAFICRGLWFLFACPTYRLVHIDMRAVWIRCQARHLQGHGFSRIIRAEESMCWLRFVAFGNVISWETCFAVSGHVYSSEIKFWIKDQVYLFSIIYIPLIPSISHQKTVALHPVALGVPEPPVFCAYCVDGGGRELSSRVMFLLFYPPQLRRCHSLPALINTLQDLEIVCSITILP